MQYVIENPTQCYGLEFIRRMHHRFGARAVCFYTDKQNLPISPRLHPELFSKEYVAAHYLVAPDALPAFIEHLRQQHSIKAVIPHHEFTVSNAINIAEGLGLDWVQPEVMRRFRDKFALKAHLRATDPGLRINHAELAASPAEALAIVRRQQLHRFVLKPNDGAGNIGVGIFAADDPQSLIEEYWQRTHAGTVLLEEFLDGPEYHCNGQVDGAGNITIINICHTRHTEINQWKITSLRSDQILSHQPEFTQIADYTRRMIVASGLRRSPFHAEFRIDKSGPRLIECGARIIGASWAPFATQMHGAPFDIMDLAAHYYGSAESYGPIGLNWQNHDASILIRIRGISTRTEKIRQLDGVREVERLPQFVQWTDKPNPGQHLTPTNSLISSPYVVMIRVRTLEDGDEVERTIRNLIKWNTRPLSLRERASYYLERVPGFIRWKLNQGRRKGTRLLDKTFLPERP